MPAWEHDFNRELANALNQIRYEWRTNPLILGGSSGSQGGSTGVPGGVIGQLGQRNVAGDTTESFLFTPNDAASLLDNLNNIRAWELPVHNFWASPTGVNTLYISSGSWYHTDGQPPLIFTGGSTPALIAPSSNSRYDLLYIDTSGNLGWITGTESVTPIEPIYPSANTGRIVLWTIYSRTSGSIISRYDDGSNHYLFRDSRPFVGGPTVFPASGSSYLDYQWYADGPLFSGQGINGVYRVPDTFHLSGAAAYLLVPPTSGSVIVDVKYSPDYGTNWNTALTSNLALTSGSYTSGSALDLYLPSGTLLRADIISVGVGAETLSVNLYGSVTAAGAGTVSIVALNVTDGITGSVTNPTTVPTINLGLGDITPDSVTSSGSINGANLSGINTGDQTISLTGDVTGAGTGAIPTSIAPTGVLPGSYVFTNLTVGADGRITDAFSGSSGDISYLDPSDVGATPSSGSSSLVSPSDHVHRGLTGLLTPGSETVYGTAALVPVAGITITESSGSFLFSASSGSGALDPSNPQDIGSAPDPGSSGLGSRGNHVHRGVTSVGYDNPAYGTITLFAGTGIGINQSGGDFTLTASLSGQFAGSAEGRLTLQTGAPVYDVAASGSMYYTPYLGNKIDLYDGSQWNTRAFVETSIDLGPLSANTIYDVFAYDNAGTLALETSQWFNSTVRDEAGDLARFEGRLVKDLDHTRKYLGTFLTNGNGGECEDNNTHRYVWNYYNRVNRRMFLSDYNNHAYASGVWRSWNDDFSLRLELVTGWNEEQDVPISLIAQMTGGDDGGPVPSLAAVSRGNTSGSSVTVGADEFIVSNSSPYIMRSGASAFYKEENDNLGYRYYQPVEYGGTGCDFDSVILQALVRQ